jgi:hypothetical protein
MKKINLLLIGGALTSIFMIQSCQQPEADQATIDAKVTESYNAEKMKVENEAATACEDAINNQVKLIQDSLSHLNAKQQADLLAKTQRELKAAQLKADALKKKAVADAKKKANKPVIVEKPKSTIDAQGNQVGKSGEREEVKKGTSTVDAQGNQVGKSGER